MKLNLLVLYTLIAAPTILSAQILHSNGGVIVVNSGAVMHANGGVTISNTSSVVNEGSIVVTKNSVLPAAGNLTINNSSIVSGNGIYRIEQDWVNDAIFNADNSEVELFGDTEQLITSNNATNTEFNLLILTGNGTNVNRRKSLVDVDASIGINGKLFLNDRELSTDIHTFEIINPNPLAISYDVTYGAEGFVSSLPSGFLIRKMNKDTVYIFPVGSSEVTTRFRPAIINTYAVEDQSYGVRMNNFLADNEGFPISQREPEIVQLNDEYYHSVRRLEGISSAGLGISYDTLVDTGWASIGHWNTSEQQWKDVQLAGINPFADYRFVFKGSWNFPTDSDEYILINVNDPSDSEDPVEPSEPITSYFLDIPNVLTPNGDNVNDLFYVTSSGLSDFNLQILNRWGNLVFESDDVNEAWNGKNLNQNECTDGVYFYIIKAKFQSEEITKHGHITLVRK